MHINKRACPIFFPAGFIFHETFILSFSTASFIIMFFLYHVIACPGVPACSGRGICGDTISGNGSCTCEVRMEQLLVMSVTRGRERFVVFILDKSSILILIRSCVFKVSTVESWFTLDQHLDQRWINLFIDIWSILDHHCGQHST